jgi:mono/diheme cytochrome c family protein
MPRTRALPAVICGVAVVAAAAGAVAGTIDKQDFQQIERGRYLTIIGDCAACHTLPGSGRDFAGGRGIETPFGLLIAPNITPDRQTGIGAWTDDEFVNALKNGTGRDGNRLYPAMPYTYYTKLTRDDALAIRAYLNTLPPVYNPVQPNQLPFPFDIRTSMLAWDKLFFTPETFRPSPAKSAEWNRGAYLAEGLAHCGMCHTPKNLLGGDRSAEYLRGYALQGWFAPDITSNPRRGIGGWSIDEIAAYLKTGHNSTSAATGPMAEMVDLSTSHMTDADLKAIAVYLKDQPSNADRDAQSVVRPDEKTMKIGAAIYADECAGCHAANGKGAAGLFPSLNGTPVVQQTDPASLLHVVLRGARSAATDGAPTGAAMPQFAWVLNDDEVAAVLTYIRNAWGNSAPPVSAADVGKARAALVERSD